ncbi:LLM class flavin-dependent oxidoreductase [Mumia quercus]|uniref:LLM class flavin-dependent oxidoreductase n=1 Tax=Mumia quercus TaxID=2976125 RepID=UPI0021D22289|nr:LLM class flavin-dependent oxidoreductase [Mumia quercus]
MTRIWVTLATRDERDWGHLPPAEERAQAVRAAEVAGLEGVVAPYDLGGEESTVLVGDALRHTRWAQALHEFHVAAFNPVYAAKIAASFQRFSAGRLAWAPLVTAPTTSQRRPTSTSADDWYARADEFLTVARGVWTQETFDFDGTYYQVKGGGFREALAGLPFPRVHLTGSDDDALALSAKHADVHVFASAQEVAKRGPLVVEQARALGREVQLGIRLSVLVRESADEAQAAADRDRNLDLVGSYAQVADELGRLAAQGVGTVILDVRPRIEETYRIGEHLLPLVRTTTPDLETTGVR